MAEAETGTTRRGVLPKTVPLWVALLLLGGAGGTPVGAYVHAMGIPADLSTTLAAAKADHEDLIVLKERLREMAVDLDRIARWTEQPGSHIRPTFDPNH